MASPCFCTTLGLSFTGYLLPWDQLAFWAITVGTNIAGYAPVVGPKLKFLCSAGNTVGQEALTRFYALHVIVLPAIACFLVAVHLLRVRKDGGLSQPEEDLANRRDDPVGQLAHEQELRPYGAGPGHDTPGGTGS